MKKLLSYARKMMSFCRWFVKRIKGQIKSVTYKINNMTESNLELGQFHLQQGNIDDAILRFKFIDKLLDPGNKLANYHLGWCYLLQGDLVLAQKHLQQGAKAGDGLLSFVENFNEVKKVPEDIYLLRRSRGALDLIKQFGDSKQDLAKKIAKSFMKKAHNLPLKYQILELGSADGALAREIRLRFQGEFNLTATESEESLIELFSYTEKEKSLYDEIYNMSVMEYVRSCKKKFNAIFNFSGFALEADLSEFFKKVYGLLDKNGYFVFMVRDAEEISLSANSLEFGYNSAQIELFLANSKFIILSTDHFMFENEIKYNIFICCK